MGFCVPGFTSKNAILIIKKEYCGALPVKSLFHSSLNKMSCIYHKVALYFFDGQRKILKKSKRLTTKIIQTFVGLLEKPFTRLYG